MPSSMSGYLLPMQKIVQQALKEDLPYGTFVGREVSANTVDQLPGVLHYESGAGSATNEQGLWPFSLQLNVIGHTSKDVWDLTSEVYRVITSWSRTRHVPGLGGVRFLQTNLLFNDVFGEMRILIGKQLAQQTGVFSMLGLHPNLFH